MILDILLRVANAQAFTDVDEVSASSVDLGNSTIKRRVGSGTPLSALFVCTTAGAGDSGSATNTTLLRVVEDTQASLATKTPVVERKIDTALQVAGAIFEVPIPSGAPTKRYLGAQVEQGTGDTSSWTVYIVPSSHIQDYLAYSKGYSI